MSDRAHRSPAQDLDPSAIRKAHTPGPREGLPDVKVPEEGARAGYIDLARIRKVNGCRQRPTMDIDGRLVCEKVAGTVSKEA